jgi:hypothetical protein
LFPSLVSLIAALVVAAALSLPCLPCIGGTFWSAISPLGRQPATQSVSDSGERGGRKSNGLSRYSL